MAYRSQFFEIGIPAVTPEHEIPLPGAEIGEPLAEAFASALGDLAYVELDVLRDGHVTRENLDRLALLAPSEIGSESDVRRACPNVLLTPAGANDEAGLSRRRTILPILKVTELLVGKPSPD